MKKLSLSLEVIFLVVFFSFSLFAEEIVFPNPEQRISMDFKDASLKDILKIFSIQSGLNFIASEAVQDRRITLYLENVPIKDAMDKIFKANNLTYELDPNSGIFIVKDWGPPKIETVTKVFILKYATVSTSSLKEEMGSLITERAGVGATAGGTTATGTATPETSEGTTRGSGKWSAVEETGITSVVKKLLSEHGSVVEDYRTNSLIVTDVPSRISLIEKVIASLDVPIPMVMLEVEMLDVAKNKVDRLGIEWPTSLLSLDVNGSRITRFPFAGKGTSGKGSTLVSSTSWGDVTWEAHKFGPSVFTLIGDTLALDFLRTQTDTKYLARPRILTLNNETAEIRIATQESVGVKETETEAGNVSAEAERVETGVILRITPQVNPETQEITMFIYPVVSEAKEGNDILTSSGTYRFRDPEIRSVKTLVKVKDGETVVLGGLIRRENTESNKKVPLLGDLPLLGAMFRHKNKTGIERELLVFITPRIIKDTSLSTDKISGIKNLDFPREQAGIGERQKIINTSLNTLEKNFR